MSGMLAQVRISSWIERCETFNLIVCSEVDDYWWLTREFIDEETILLAVQDVWSQGSWIIEKTIEVKNVQLKQGSGNQPFWFMF